MLKTIQSIANKIIKQTMPSIIRKVRADALTYLEEDALRDLYDNVVQLEKEKKPGVLIEAGCAHGGSGIVLASAKSRSRPLRIYDVFGMIPPPSTRDESDVHSRYEVIRSGRAQGIDGNTYYGYEDDLDKQVSVSFEKYGLSLQENNIRLIKGFFDQTMLIEEQVALAHIDCDWHDSVMVCLQRIEPKIVPGGSMIIDDYDTWSGCRAAVEAYFEDKKNNFEFVKKARLQIIKR